MVPTANVITLVVMSIVSFLLPIIGCVIVWRRSKASLINALIGATIFFICYIIAVATSLLGSMLIASPVVLTLVLALRAGLVEEFGRFVAFKWMLKRRNALGDALMYGVGHGGMEVWLVYSLTMVSNLFIIVTANSGAMDMLIASAPEQAEVLNAAVDVLAKASPLYLSVGLVERIVAMALHISLSVIVFCAVRQKKWLYLLLAIALHFLGDCSILLVVTGAVDMWTFELILALLVVGVAIIAWRIARGYRPPCEPWETGEPPAFPTDPQPQA